MSTTIKLRRDTAANWTSVNPTLAQGEVGVETDTGQIKIGDGATAWASLSYGPQLNAVTISGLLTLAGGQIAFPATQVPSSDPNTLDDYEEGTWTPTDGSGAGLTLTTSESAYIKVGQLVVIQGYITYPTTADGSNAVIGGLPFVSPYNANGGCAVWTTYGALTVSTEATFQHLLLWTPTGAHITNADMSGKNLSLMAFYRTSA